MKLNINHDNYYIFGSLHIFNIYLPCACALRRLGGMSGAGHPLPTQVNGGGGWRGKDVKRTKVCPMLG